MLMKTDDEDDVLYLGCIAVMECLTSWKSTGESRGVLGRGESIVRAVCSSCYTVAYFVLMHFPLWSAPF